MFRALLDTCVLFKSLLCDTLLCIAEEELFQPLWSEDILEELRRDLLRQGISASGVDHRIGRMVEHFPGAMVTGYRSLIESMKNHPKDRHVLAAAVRGDAELIVTLSRLRRGGLSTPRSSPPPPLSHSILKRLCLCAGVGAGLAVDRARRASEEDGV